MSDHWEREKKEWASRALSPRTVMLSDLIVAALVHPGPGRDLAHRAKREIDENNDTRAALDVLAEFVEGADRYEARRLKQRLFMPEGMREIVAALQPGAEVPNELRAALLQSPDARLRTEVMLAMAAPAPEPEPTFVVKAATTLLRWHELRRRAVAALDKIDESSEKGRRLIAEHDEQRFSDELGTHETDGATPGQEPQDRARRH